jgi:hypothetical protein
MAACLGLGTRWHGAQIAAFVATIAGTLQLVFNFGERARFHEFLQRRYYELLEQIAKKQVPEEGDITNWLADSYRIYAEEPPPYRALDAMAYNAAARATGRTSCRKLNLWQRLCRHCIRFDNSEFPPVPSQQ